MITNFLLVIIFVMTLYLSVKCINISKNKIENYDDVNITSRGLRLDPLFVQVPKIPSLYKGYIDYPTTELLDLCPSIKKKQLKESVKCQTRADCGAAEVCVNDGITSYCQCSISNDCVNAGVC